MFTGIVAAKCKVTQVLQVDTRADLWLDLGTWSDGLQLGASVAVDGVCLTAVEQQGNRVLFQVIRETLERSTLGQLKANDWVNVERSYRVGDELGGHEVSGHVMGTGVIAQIENGLGQTSMRIEVPGDWMKYVLPKGFIAVDGASLTIGATDAQTAAATEVPSSFWIHLIPETLNRTTLGTKTLGQRVNIELDARTVAVVHTVERVMANLGVNS